METNPYQSPSIAEQLKRSIAFAPLNLILIPAYLIGSFIAGAIGAVITYFICIDIAINVAYRRDPGGFYDEDALNGDELPFLVWHSPTIVFFAILGACALLGYKLFRARDRRP